MVLVKAFLPLDVRTRLKISLKLCFGMCGGLGHYMSILKSRILGFLEYLERCDRLDCDAPVFTEVLGSVSGASDKVTKS